MTGAPKTEAAGSTTRTEGRESKDRILSAAHFGDLSSRIRAVLTTAAFSLR